LLDFAINLNHSMKKLFLSMALLAAASSFAAETNDSKERKPAQVCATVCCCSASAFGVTVTVPDPQACVRVCVSVSTTNAVKLGDQDLGMVTDATAAVSLDNVPFIPGNSYSISQEIVVPRSELGTAVDYVLKTGVYVANSLGQIEVPILPLN
jgi:ABC-type Fe3+-hydroxamate transport system substrate-binding protein